MKSVLIIGSPADNFCIHLGKFAAHRNIISLFIDMHDIFQRSDIEFYFNSGIKKNLLVRGLKAINAKNFYAVFPRLTDLKFNSDDYSTDDGNYINIEWNAFYKAWLHSIKVPVINQILPQYWSKKTLCPADLCIFSEKLNLLFPVFITSNNPSELKKFFTYFNSKTVYSPLTQPTVSYKIDSKEKFTKLLSVIKHMYVTLTELIEGDIHKIFIIKDKSFAVNSKGSMTDLIPEYILSDCKFIARNLNLTFSKFLITNKEKKFYLTSVSLYPDFYGCSNESANVILNEIFNLIMS